MTRALPPCEPQSWLCLLLQPHWTSGGFLELSCGHSTLTLCLESPLPLSLHSQLMLFALLCHLL